MDTGTITPLLFTDEQLVSVQNGLILEIKRVASGGNIAQLEHTIKAYRHVEPAVNAAIARLIEAENAEKPN